MTSRPPVRPGEPSRAGLVRAMGVAEILDTALLLMRRDWRAFAPLWGVWFLANLAGGVYTSVTTRDDGTSDGSPWIVVAAIALDALLNAMQTYAGAQVCRGRSWSVSASLLAIVRNLPAIAVTAVVSSISALSAVGGLMAVPMFLGYGGMILDPGIFVASAAAGLVLTVPSAVIAAGTGVSLEVAVLEGRGSVASLRRSWRLTRGHRWRVLGVLSAGVLPVFLSLGVGALLDAMLGLGPIPSAVLSLVAGVFSTLLGVMLYFDLRCRVEAFDLEILADRVAGRG